MRISQVIIKGFLLIIHFPYAVSSQSCEPGVILIAGSLPVERLASAWGAGYLAECGGDSGDMPSITVEIGGSLTGAMRVCGTRVSTLPVDIGGMTRSWNDQEASTEDGWHFSCSRSTRSVIQVEVGVEGIAATVTAGSAGDRCIQESLGGGLSLDQLRWIYSNYGEAELIEWGWNASSVPFTDGDRDTRRWSELSQDCTDEEILIAGPPEGSNEWDIFQLNVFRGNDETFVLSRKESFFTADPENATDEIISYLANPNSIAYLGIVDVLTKVDQDTISLINYVDPEGTVIPPSGVSFQDGSFPLNRRLHMNFFDDEKSLTTTRPLLEYGLFAEDSDDLAKRAGVWPISESMKIEMATRLQTASGLSLAQLQEECGPKNGKITIAGSSTVFPIANEWSKIYMMACPTIEVVVEGGGSSAGAGRVCGNEEKGSPVTIGNMSREWKVPDEAINPEKDFLYECEAGDSSRAAVQVDVAIDGLTVAVKEGGVAWRCLKELGGLTVHQLRWVYSSYSDTQLEETGWDPSALANSDNDPSTHSWNELDPSCDDVEIRIAGADDASGTYEYFLETILVDFDNGETFAIERPVIYENSEEDDHLVEYLENHGEAISYFGYAYYYDNIALLSAVAIENEKGELVVPDKITIGDGTYNPLSRRIYMNLLNTPDVLAHSAPFIEFGLNHPELVEATGYVPIPNEDVEIFITERIEPALNAGSGNKNTPAIIGGCVGGAVAVVCLVFMYYKCCRDTKGAKKPTMHDSLSFSE